MMIVDILFIILLALLFASLLTGPVGWRHSRTETWIGAFLFSLLVLLPGLFLALVWLPQTGPALMGVYWLGPLAVGLLLFFLIAAAAPPPRRLPPGTEPRVDRDQLAAASATAIFIDVMFWLFLLAAVVLLIVGLAT